MSPSFVLFVHEQPLQAIKDPEISAVMGQAAALLGAFTDPAELLGLLGPRLLDADSPKAAADVLLVLSHVVRYVLLSSSGLWLYVFSVSYRGNAYKFL